MANNQRLKDVQKEQQKPVLPTITTLDEQVASIHKEEKEKIEVVKMREKDYTTSLKELVEAKYRLGLVEGQMDMLTFLVDNENQFTDNLDKLKKQIADKRERIEAYNKELEKKMKEQMEQEDKKKKEMNQKVDPNDIPIVKP